MPERHGRVPKVDCKRQNSAIAKPPARGHSRWADDLRTQAVCVVQPWHNLGAHDTLMCAVVTQEFGNVLDVGMPTDAWFDVPAMTTQQLDFQLRDRNYNVLSIVPNISFVLLID